MADRQTRQLERLWKCSGAPEEGVIYFRARMRAGDLSPDRLKLAAYLGDEAARRALGVSEVRIPPEIQRWVRVLACWGHEALIRTLLVTARWNLEKWEGLVWDRRPRSAIESTEAWLRCPCPSHARVASASAGEASQALVDLSDVLIWYHKDPLERNAMYRVLSLVAENAARAAELAARGPKTDLRQAADETVRSVIECLTSKGMFLRSVELQMREAIARELIPWALAPSAA